MTELSKIAIELIAMALMWIAVDYKREKTYRIRDKEWWVQFILLGIAIVIIKNLHKF